MLKAATLVEPGLFEDYLDVVEQYREKADQGSMMAYTSSWGEANPGGGKEGELTLLLLYLLYFCSV